MRILFLCRQKKNGKISQVIWAQSVSLDKLVELKNYPLTGKGWKAYLRSIGELRKFLKANKFDLIHAHYSYVGMIASLATRKPVVVSLMGSDVEDFWIGRELIRIFAKFCWKDSKCRSSFIMAR